jgi:ABC-2 type transport system ATP-binding protein
MVELSTSRHKIVKTFSGGMKRRLEIARGFLHLPRVLFLDEPTIGLDPQTRKVIWEYINELKRNFGVTLFLTTHYMEEADDSDRVGIIHQGKLVSLDSLTG